LRPAPKGVGFFVGGIDVQVDLSKMDYPKGAAQVRDLIREILKSQVDHGSPMDTGGGMGGADLWASFGGVEFVICVKPVK
jgi:hypothetical protein